jgi:hypothetical protein
MAKLVLNEENIAATAGLVVVGPIIIPGPHPQANIGILLVGDGLSAVIDARNQLIIVDESARQIVEFARRLHERSTAPLAATFAAEQPVTVEEAHEPEEDPYALEVPDFMAKVPEITDAQPRERDAARSKRLIVDEGAVE